MSIIPIKFTTQDKQLERQLNDFNILLSDIIFNGKYFKDGSIDWNKVSKTGSDITDIETREHDDLQGIDENNHHDRLHALNSTDDHSGLLDDSQLSANVPLLDAENTFIAANTFPTVKTGTLNVANVLELTSAANIDFHNTIMVDDIIEHSPDHGINIDGISVKDITIYADTITEKTTDNGVNIETVGLKDGNVTLGSGKYLLVDAGKLEYSSGELQVNKYLNVNVTDTGVMGALQVFGAGDNYEYTKIGLFGGIRGGAAAGYWQLIHNKSGLVDHSVLLKYANASDKGYKVIYALPQTYTYTDARCPIYIDEEGRVGILGTSNTSGCALTISDDMHINATDGGIQFGSDTLLKRSDSYKITMSGVSGSNSPQLYISATGNGYTYGRLSVGDGTRDYTLMMTGAGIGAGDRGGALTYWNGSSLYIPLQLATPAYSATTVIPIYIDASGNIEIDKDLTIGDDVKLARGAANRLDLADGDSFKIVNGTLYFGADVALSRDADSVLSLALEDTLLLQSQTATNNAIRLFMWSSGETPVRESYPRNSITFDGIKFGSGSDVEDVKLYRQGADILGLNGNDSLYLSGTGYIEVAGSGDISTSTGFLKGKHKSSDGTAGLASGSFVDNDGNTVTVKDGLITAITAP